MSRPSHKEISKKTAQAKAAVASGNISILNMLSLVGDADELGYVIEDDLDGLLMELLGKSSLDNYTGTRPPQKSYQQEVQGAELFAFVIEGTSLNGLMATLNNCFFAQSLRHSRMKNAHI